MRKWIRIILTGLLILIIILGLFFYLNVRDRHPGYQVDLNINNPAPGNFRIGFAAVKITPTIIDNWTDANQDAQFIEKDGDSYQDLNQNGRFDPIWIAGFSNKRAANGVNDDLWARTMIVDDGTSRIALTSIDAIGFMNDDVLDVRKLIPESTNITYSVISSTHTHEAPDLLGLWGNSYFRSGVNEDYMNYVKTQTAASIVQASQNLEPAYFKLAINPKDAIVTVNDTREPKVFDEAIRIIQAFSLSDSTTLGTLVAWADHPETLWSDNLLISSDFPHYLRDGVENGIYLGDSLVREGLGGTTVYFNGAIGGLMTTNPSHEIKDILTGEVIKEPGYPKTKAQGDFLAWLVLDALDSSSNYVSQAGINIRAKTIALEFQNPLYRLGAFLGVLDRGMTGWMKIRSELAVFSIGPAHFITVPGELYPEIVNGGVEKPAGGDFDIEPQEVPPLRDFMQGEYNFIFGLTNDMVGYIIPKSQWDTEAPFTYHNHDAPYGEINSLGPETGPAIYRELVSLMEEFYPE
ncbi:MAG: hypothetical protein ACNS62_22915 [Candidatus Cyclobacteriaceae bacterium M3_2C_046]